jgi:hypothetical protein
VLSKDLPLRVLTHGIPWLDQEFERNWQDIQRQVASWSTRSKLIIAEESSHSIMLAQPKLVVDAIREIVEALRE